MAMACSKENDNYGCLCRLLIDAGTVVLYDVLDKQLNRMYPSKTLEDILNLPQLQYDLSLVCSFNGEQQCLLYPQNRGKDNLGPASKTIKLYHLDISLISIILRNIAGICPAHWKVWEDPQPHDLSPAANIARIRIFGNSLYGHKTTAALTDTEFNKTWDDIVHVLLQLSNKYSKQDFNVFRSLFNGVDVELKYSRLLEIWCREACLYDAILSKTKKILEYIRILPTVENRIEKLPTVEVCATVIKTHLEETLKRVTPQSDKSGESTAKQISQLATFNSTFKNENLELDSDNTRALLKEHDFKREQETEALYSAIVASESNILQNQDKRTEQLCLQLEEITLHIDKTGQSTAEQISHLATGMKETFEIESRNIKELLQEQASKRTQEADDIHPAIQSAESNIQKNQDKRTETQTRQFYQRQGETCISRRYDESETGQANREGNKTELSKANRLRPRNPDFKGRERLLDEISQKLNEYHRTTVCGLGGIGKTTLVTEYAHLNKGRYDLIRWIGADDESLQSSVSEFADDLGIEIRGQNVEATAKQIFKKIRELTSWLLIFDNATDYESLKSVLPAFDSLRASHNILITSRNPNWRSFIRLDTFSEDEAIMYIKQVCGETNADEDCRTLAQTLDFLPLALGHATQYIRQHCTSIRVYLEIYEANKIELLSTSFQLEDDSEKTVMNTWSTSEKKIREKSEDAIKLLQWCAFLSPDNIPLAFFESSSLLASNVKIYQAVRLLRDYSMISPSFENDCIKIHRLVQFAIRYKLTTQNMYNVSRTLTPLVSKLTDGASAHPSTPELAQSTRTYLTHIRVLLSYVTDDLLLELFDTTEQLMCNACYRLNNIQQTHDALLIGERLLTLQEKRYGFDHVKLIDTLQRMAFSKKSTGNTEGAVQLYEKSLERTIRHYGSESVKTAEVRRMLADVVRMLGKKHEAVCMHRASLPIIERHYGKDSLVTAGARERMGLAVMESGDPHEALEIYHDVMPVYETCGKQSIKVAYLQVFTGLALSQLGDDQGARNLCEQAISIGQKHYGKTTGVVAQWQEWLAMSMVELGHPSDAFDSYKRIIPIYQTHYVEDHLRVACAQINMAAALNSLGDPGGAITLVQQAKPIIENKRGRDCVEMALAHENMAQALYQQGHPQDAVLLFKQSISIKEQKFHSTHVNVARTLYKLSVCLESLCQHQETRDIITRAYTICEDNNCKPHYPVMAKIMKLREKYYAKDK